MAEQQSKRYTLNFAGDVMLGRKIDQLFPTHLDDPSIREIVDKLKQEDPSLNKYTHLSPWGTALPLLKSADLNIINLENAVTTHDTPWPGKKYTFRMHPANLAALQHAHISFASLANNHTLDFGSTGLQETVRSLLDAGIYSAGAGTTPLSSRRPAILSMPTYDSHTPPPPPVCVWAISDNYPEEWVTDARFSQHDYSTATRLALKALVEKANVHLPRGVLRVFSVHWGPNYAWRPAGAIVALARFLVDDCGVHIVHGHSSHHVQGVERREGGGVILYGCGDLVDDFEVDEGMEAFRSKLGAVWRVSVAVNDQGELRPETLEVHPTRIESFRAMVLGKDDEDHEWVRGTVARLSREFGTVPREELGDKGQLVFDL